MIAQYRNQLGEVVAMMQVKFPVTALWLERATIKLIMLGTIDRLTAPKKLVRKLVLDLIKETLVNNGRSGLDYYPDDFRIEYPDVEYIEKLSIAELICKQYFPEFYN